MSLPSSSHPSPLRSDPNPSFYSHLDTRNAPLELVGTWGGGGGEAERSHVALEAVELKSVYVFT